MLIQCRFRIKIERGSEMYPKASKRGIFIMADLYPYIYITFAEYSHVIYRWKANSMYIQDQNRKGCQKSTLRHLKGVFS